MFLCIGTINYKLCVGSLYLNIHSTSSQQLSSRGALYKTRQYKRENTEDTFPPQHLAIEGRKNEQKHIQQSLALSGWG